MENKIYITDEKGKEIEMNILFTFEMDEKNYVIVYEGNNEDDLYALQYDEDGNLFVVEDPIDLCQIQQVVDAFDGIDDDDEEQEEEKEN